MSFLTDEYFFYIEDCTADVLAERPDGDDTGLLAFQDAHSKAASGDFLGACLGIYRCLVELEGYNFVLTRILGEVLDRNWAADIKALPGGLDLLVEIQSGCLVHHYKPGRVMSLDELESGAA